MEERVINVIRKVKSNNCVALPLVQAAASLWYRPTKAV